MIRKADNLQPENAHKALLTEEYKERYKTIKPKMEKMGHAIWQCPVCEYETSGKSPYYGAKHKHIKLCDPIGYKLGKYNAVKTKVLKTQQVDDKDEKITWRCPVPGCKHGLYVVRRHAKTRKQLFIPRRVQGAPPCRALSAMRVTIGTFVDGEPFRRVDAWTTRSSAHEELSKPWRGCTIFLLKTA